MTNDEMKSIFKMVLAGWPTQRQKLDAEDELEMTKLYHAGLGDLDYEIAKAAIIRVVHTAKFIPTVAEIREAAGVLKHGNRRAGAEAWGEVIAKIRRYGWMRQPGVDFYFEDPITERIVASFSWEILCAGEGDAIIADRARFITAYEQMSTAARADAASSPNMESAMLTMRTELPTKKLPAPHPLLSPEARTQALQEVLNEARALNPGVALALPATSPVLLRSIPPSSEAVDIVDEPSCDCSEEYMPPTYDGRCPNCRLFRFDEHGVNLHVVGDD